METKKKNNKPWLINYPVIDPVPADYLTIGYENGTG